MKESIAQCVKKEGLLEIARLQETYERALLVLIDDAVAVPEDLEVEEDLGPVEDEDVQQITVALEDEQFFEIEVNRQAETGNASSEDESDSESSIEAVVVVPKRQKKANTMIGDISKGKYSRS
jgi:hypothetical protein